ncbi:MAG: sulfite exporter TauE/SafE family protein [Chlamydiales bacterium]|nr:sulfite exporter TauE/SafE family protein [Chlamydiia bacterium]MCP5507143.1 sulfite exporter TauE/SafE family protein [Chlamydiales bacterium]
MLTLFLVFALIGLFAGFLAGLLGIGGGIFTVPAFLFAFYIFDFPSEYNIQVAIGTSLGVMVFTAISSAWSHFLKKGIQWNFLRYYAPGVIGGVVLGAFIADLLPARQLVLLFSAYIFCFGVYFVISAFRRANPYLVENKLKDPYPITAVSVGIIAGTISAALGVGGAPITIPFLTAHRVELKHAISTSAFVSLLVGSIGSLSYLFFGLNERISDGSIGYLYLPGLLITGITSIASAPIGARLAYMLPIPILRAIFGSFLIVVSIILFRR